MVERRLDGYLKNNLDKMKMAVRRKDTDFVLIIDGHTGSGKSVFSFQIAKNLDPSFSINDVAFTSEEFFKLIKNAQPKKAVVFDEATRGLYSKEGMTKFNILLEKQINEVRQRNLFIIIVLPSIFYLSKLFALDRANALLHVYTGDNYERGYFAWYTPDLIKKLFIKGYKTFDYRTVNPNFVARFSNRYDIPEEEYRQKKKAAFQELYSDTENKNDKKPEGQIFYKNTKLLIRLLSLLNYCYKDLKFTKEELAKGMSQTNIEKVTPLQVTSTLKYVSALKNWTDKKELYQENRCLNLGLNKLNVEKLEETKLEE